MSSLRIVHKVRRTVRRKNRLHSCIGITLLSMLLAGSIDAGSAELRNEELMVRFTSGTTSRMTNRDGAHLLYPGTTSPMIVRVNGRDVVLANDNLLGVETFQAGTDIMLRYRLLDDCVAEVRYTLAGPAMRIRVRVRNAGRQPARVAARILLDTQIGPNDGSPFYVQGIGLVTHEREWSPAPFSDWFSYDRYPNPRISGYGRLETAPERLILGDWRRIDRGRFDYRPGGGSFTHDSALLAYYDLGAVPPGGVSRTVSLAYGSAVPEEESLDRELAAALRLVAEATRLKNERDLQTLAAVDAAALYALTDGQSERRHLAALLGGTATDLGSTVTSLQADSIVRALIESGMIEAKADMVGTSVTLGFGFIKIIHRMLAYAHVTAHRLQILQDRFLDYIELWGSDEMLSRDELERRILEYHVAAQAGSPVAGDDERTLRDRVGSIMRLADDLESGRVSLPEEYPYEAVIDCLARLQTALRGATEYETMVVYPSHRGDGMRLGILGTLAPVEQVLVADRGHDRARRYRTGASVVGMAGPVLGVGVKVAVAIKTGGTTAVVEWIAKGAAAAGSIGSVGLGHHAMNIELSSDMLHALMSGMAAANYAWEQTALTAILEGVERGVPAARDTGLAEAVSIRGIEVQGVEEAQGMTQLGGELRLENRNENSLPVSVLMTVSALGADQPPVAIPALYHQDLPPGRHRMGFSLSLPPLEQLDAMGDTDAYWLRTAVSTGWRDIKVDQTVVSLSRLDAVSVPVFREIGRGELETGESSTHEVVVADNTQSAIFYLTYEGSRLDLLVIDPQGRRIGPDYERGAMHTDLPESIYDAGADSVRIRIPNPVPGRYRVTVQAVAAHLRESYALGITERARSERAVAAIRPDTVLFVPEDEPDMLAFEIVELTGDHDGGEIVLPDVAGENWRVSAPALDAGGSVRLEIRRPAELWRDGMRNLRVRVGEQDAAVRFESAPPTIAGDARIMAAFLQTLRAERSRLLRQIGAGSDLWEAFRFGEPSDAAWEPDWRQAVEAQRGRVLSEAAAGIQRRPPPSVGSRTTADDSSMILTVGVLLAGLLLLVFVGGGTGTIIWAHRDARRRIRIGRAPDNDLVIDDESVSRYHATLYCQSDGSWRVEDLGSTCGTWVGEAPVDRRRVSDNEKIRFGSVLLSVAEVKRRAGREQ